MLPPPRSRTEAEERRRSWWVVFLADRYLASTTGWPSLVDETHIRTHLPGTEGAFCVPPTPFAGSLDQLRLGGRLSPFAIRILAAGELLHTLDHCAHHHLRPPGPRPEGCSLSLRAPILALSCRRGNVANAGQASGCV